MTDNKMSYEPPYVGVAVVIWKEGKILLGEDHAKSNIILHGVSGGHWESEESLTEAVKREVLEEAGITITNIRLISVYDFFRQDKNKSYVTIGFEADWIVLSDNQCQQCGLNQQILQAAILQ
jgi:ADP-ribose pyrophosphatase YjhB (NUDIX family)